MTTGRIVGGAVGPLLYAVLLLGCGSDPTKGKPQAEVVQAPATPTPEQPSKEPSAPAAAAPGAAITLSPEGGSRIGFVGAKVTGSHEGEFKQWKGAITLAEGAPLESGTVEVEIEMVSVETDAEKLTAHLKSGDFFEVEKHPKARFKSTKLEPADGAGATHKVTGDLTLRGVTKAVAFPATIERKDGKLSVKAEFSINRKDFGIVYPGMPDNLIRDDVLIKLDLKG